MPFLKHPERAPGSPAPGPPHLRRSKALPARPRRVPRGPGEREIASIGQAFGVDRAPFLSVRCARGVREPGDRLDSACLEAPVDTVSSRLGVPPGFPDREITSIRGASGFDKPPFVSS